MEMDQGKLFIGGISWDTNEDRLKEYFGTYGEVVDAVIMRDRTTGRPRGFGFVVFANPSDAERVLTEKHTIDGRTVEAKRALPRDDHRPLTNNRTKKIFVGGLPSTVTEADFKGYFEQFGTINDVVVMYDHNTQRPRGFGFITYDSEDVVDRVLHKTFHELNGKLVEVKRAVPRELSPRNPLVSYNSGRGEAGFPLFPYSRQGYNMGSIRDHQVRMDSSRYRPLSGFEQSLGVGFGGGPGGFIDNLGGYRRVLSPYYENNQARYNTPIGSNVSGSRRMSFISPSPPLRNPWGNGLGSSSVTESASYFGGANWGASSTLPSVGGGSGRSSYGALGMGGFGRNGVATTTSSFAGSGGSFKDFYQGGLVYGDTTWQNNVSTDQDNYASLGYRLGGGKDSDDYVVGYDTASRQPSREG